MEIDFNIHKIQAPAIIYIHPSQIHKTKDSTIDEVFVIGPYDENISSDYPKILEETSSTKQYLKIKIGYQNLSFSN